MFDLFDLDPNVKIIQFKRNFGQSAAMKAGFDHAAGTNYYYGCRSAK